MSGPFQKSGSEGLADHPPGGGEPVSELLAAWEEWANCTHTRPPEENELDASTASKGPLRLSVWLLHRLTDVQ